MKHIEVEKRKLCNLILINDLRDMEREVKEFEEIDKSLAKSSNDLKSI